jgi:hypothetical protein
MNEKIHNAADKEAVEKKQAKVDLNEQQHIKDLKELLATGAGLRFLSTLFDNTHVFSSVFDKHSSTMSLKEGARSVGLKYLGYVCEAAPERIPDLIMRTSGKEK